MQRWLIPLMVASGSAAGAQPVVTSTGPDSVSVTVYRDPDRGSEAINARIPQGFALISETRRILLPAGDAVIRFEGVADGMIAVSAVVAGLPGGVVQKNRDARLLSPATLTLGALGKVVHLRRTNPVTGKTVEQDAIVRSTPDGALVVETTEGVEALRCAGLPETITHDGVPSDLSVTPTLSVETSSPQAVTARVTLTYLATGFDWGASYVARIAPDGRTLDLFAWLTLVNSNSVSFADSQLLAIAGRLNRASDYEALSERPEAPPLYLRCWPEPRYGSDTGEYRGQGGLPPPAPMMMAAEAQDIVVTSRSVAAQEDLGDLKLYRVPMRVNISAHAQKQVALLHQSAIPFDSYFTARLAAAANGNEGAPLTRMIRFANRRDKGAGISLPSGDLSIFAPRGPESLLLAQATVRDHAVDEMVNLAAGPDQQVRFVQIRESEDEDVTRYSIRLTNAAADSRAAEIEVQDDPQARLQSPSRRLTRRNGVWLWKVVIPANGTARLDYLVRQYP